MRISLGHLPSSSKLNDTVLAALYLTAVLHALAGGQTGAGKLSWTGVMRPLSALLPLCHMVLRGHVRTPPILHILSGASTAPADMPMGILLFLADSASKEGKEIQAVPRT